MLSHIFKKYKSISISTYSIKHIFCMNIFYIHNPTQSLTLTTTLLIINKQQISFIEIKVIVNGLLIARTEP